MSDHRIDIIQIQEVLPHPNPKATKLEFTHVFGWQCCIPKGQFKKNDKAIYIPPDFLVPTDYPAFNFLKKPLKSFERIKVRRFMGTISQGLIINLPKNLNHLNVGTNVIKQLGIKRYEPPLPKTTGGDFVKPPYKLYAPKFDVENIHRWINKFVQNEIVYVTEKIHGASSRFTYAQNKDQKWTQFCGSRTHWMKENQKNIWWMAFRQCPEIGKWCKENPTKILYGEVFGNVQFLRYGAGINDIFFAAFAILHKNNWLDFNQARKIAPNIPWVPTLYHGPFNIKIIKNLAEGNTCWKNATNIREGCVVLPEFERTDSQIGRLQLKCLNNIYLEKD